MKGKGFTQIGLYISMLQDRGRRNRRTTLKPLPYHAIGTITKTLPHHTYHTEVHFGIRVKSKEFLVKEGPRNSYRKLLLYSRNYCTLTYNQVVQLKIYDTLEKTSFFVIQYLDSY